MSNVNEYNPKSLPISIASHFIVSLMFFPHQLGPNLSTFCSLFPYIDFSAASARLNLFLFYDVWAIHFLLRASVRL